ncbi:MAG: aminotransferase class I/II-fold pyridoxal phosphate-dependent enzyme [Acidimicrobiia bacterium]|nr:aminotransferase class I/II-fold pyridoxal phosphate-dependent enzyme [Acidimicrobiia bacterium]
MAKTRATSGLDLHIERTGHRVRAGLETALREAIRDGRLQAGTQLPSTRALASDQGLARNTVSEAYDQLVAEGWLTARQGSGTFVADLDSVTPLRATSATAESLASIRFDLRPGQPDLTSFPRSAWLSATRSAMGAASDQQFGYGHLRGAQQLQNALAAYLGRARGVIAHPDQVIICNGFTSGLDLICDVLVHRGTTRFVIEALGHTLHHRLLARREMQIATIPVDGVGAVVSELPSADAVLLTPAHQHPLGGALHPARRRAVTTWANQEGAVIIEDDYDGEFRYDRKSVGALQSLAPDRVVYSGTASKSLVPGLRLGWLIPPNDMLEELIEAQRLTGRHASIVDQVALAHLIESGGYDRHIRRMRNIYRRRRDRLESILTERVPSARVRGVAAGLHAVVELPPGKTEDEVVATARERGLALTGLSETIAEAESPPPALVIGFGTPPSHSYTAALARLVAVLEHS